LRPAVVFQDAVYSLWHNGVWQQGLSLIVNLDMIDRLGLVNPVDLFEAGNWNWDTFRQFLNDATQSVGGGAIDHVGFNDDAWALFIQLIGVNDGFLVNPHTFQVDLGSPNSMQALELIYEIIVEDQSWAGAHEDIPDENIALRAMHAFSWGDVEFRFDMVPWPAGPGNTSGVTTVQTFPQGFTFPIGTDVDFSFQMWDEVYSWMGPTPDLLREVNIDQVAGRVHYETTLQRFLTYIEPHTRQRHEIGWIATPEFNPFFVENFLENFLARTMTPATAVATFEAPLQDIVDRWLAGE
jgi:hypothetical protein